MKALLNKPWVKALVYILLGVLFLAGVWISLRQYVLLPGEYTPPPTPVPATPVPPAPTPEVSEEPTPPPSPTPPPDLPDPVRLYFPRFEQQCDVEPVGFTEDGRSIATLDSAEKAAWFELSASPGEAGNAIFNGHVSFRKKAGTFSILTKMEPGDEVVVEYADGSFGYFAVATVDVYPRVGFPSEVQRTDPGGEPRMTLITCDGEFNQEAGTRDHRAVVVCVPKES